jgi:hypothetical protein
VGSLRERWQCVLADCVRNFADLFSSGRRRRLNSACSRHRQQQERDGGRNVKSSECSHGSAATRAHTGQRKQLDHDDCADDGSDLDADCNDNDGGDVNNRQPPLQQELGGWTDQ